MPSSWDRVETVAASEKAMLTLRRFRIRELETRWLRRAAWLGPIAFALVLGAMARGGYPRWRLAAAFAWAAALSAWPILAAWRCAPGVLDERSFRRAWSGGGVIEAEALVEERPGGGAAEPAAGTLRERVEAFEKRLIAEAMASAGGNQSEAARLLGASRQTLIDKLRKYGL